MNYFRIGIDIFVNRFNFKGYICNFKGYNKVFIYDEVKVLYS